MGPIGFSFVHKCWTILRVGVVVLGIRLALRYKTLPWVLEQFSPCSMTVEPDDAAMKILAYYVDRWLRLFPYNRRGNCFPRSLALYRFARQRGYLVRFHCGVRNAAFGLDGHAWLTLGSEAFHEPGKHWQDFTVTFSYPPDLTKMVSQGSAIHSQGLTLES
ncbi:MAG: lasso peptide biosynthesis B2 protein [Nitrospira sp.]|nr:lasso peptide biosynthesis B2 protein [Nitrospira sp.]MDH4371714.1 lasso peptide biosynthesis B2 protein [Nitrospira sp.]MDH5348233.1 lasso peptide biosynthesis B2 protein [Nitrospira sp.]MDH5499150.1 lasso peptide biosynthesis B2 protein [Nitrospira sp.]MDH5725294.1 lasso peptide biosynthesis B2 protein [Nitrospira sp.]